MRFSRTRSKTTIVSWTEKPMTVSIAVTNSASTWRPKNVPPMAKMPTTTMTSWTSAAIAVMPIRKSAKRKVIQPRIPAEPRTIRSSACWASSALMIGPIDASWRTSSMGPNWRSRATRRAARRPSVGRPIGLAEGDGDGDGEGLALAEVPALADALGLADGCGLGDADGPGVGVTDGAGVGEALAPGEPLAPGDPDGRGLGEAGDSGGAGWVGWMGTDWRSPAG